MTDLKKLCVELEHYETPEWAVEQILQEEVFTRTIVDPCTGTGVLSRFALANNYNVLSIDIHDWGYFGTHVYDYLKIGSVHDLIPFAHEFSVLMNPPFSKAVQFVEKSFDLGARKIACFQRFNWYESKGRRAFWDKYTPSRVWICGDRAACWRHDLPVNSKGDRYDPETGRMLAGTPTAHAWFIFDRDYKGSTVLDRIYKDN